MCIIKFVAKGPNGTERSDIINHMPPGIMWQTFHENVNGTTVLNGKRLKLLVLEGNPSDLHFRTNRDKVRSILKDMTIRVEYEDLYGEVMQPVERPLSWFGRHEQEKEQHCKP